jgi:hypothetical protein
MLQQKGAPCCSYGAGGGFWCRAEGFEDGAEQQQPAFGSVHAHNAYAWGEWERSYLSSYDGAGGAVLRLDAVDTARYRRQEADRADRPSRGSLIGAEPDWGPEALGRDKRQ